MVSDNLIGKKMNPWIARVTKVMACLFAVLVVPVALYYRTVAQLPLMSQDFVEVQMAIRSPWQFFVNSAYIEPCFYYRPGWRLLDYLLSLLGASGVGGTVQATHFATLGVFVMCALLVFSLLWRMTGRDTLAAMLGTLLFVAHPAMVAPVVWISARWALYTGGAFLVAALYWEVILPRLVSAKLSMQILLCGVGGLLVFAVPMVSETGTVGMGALGLWILARALMIGRQDGNWMHPLTVCAVLLAPMPVLYFAMRANAIGTMFGSVNDISHIPVWQRPGLWLLGIQQDLNVLLGPFALGFLDIETARDSRSMLAVGLSGLAAIALVCYPLYFRAGRRFVGKYPLPFLLLLVFFLFQIKALWLLVKPPLSVGGYYRGYAYVLPVCALALAGGLWLRALRGRARAVLATILFVWVGFACVHTNRALNLWVRGGEMLNRQQQEMTPRLTALPENTRIRMEGFDDWLAVPYCQQAFVWDWTHLQILEAWAGKKLKVEASTFDHPLAPVDTTFDGYIVRYDSSSATLVWQRVQPEGVMN